MIKYKEMIIGRKTLQIQDTKWICIKCNGSGKRTMSSNEGFQTINCPSCNKSKNQVTVIKECNRVRANGLTDTEMSYIKVGKDQAKVEKLIAKIKKVV